MARFSTKNPGDATDGKLAGCFVDLVLGNPKPQERVSVTDVCRALGIDRKTFYNHFDNTSDLIIWIFRSDLAARLTKPDFMRAELVFPGEELNDKYRELPFYARFATEDGLLMQGRFFRELTDLLNQRRAFYHRILAYDCYIDFYLYLQSLYMSAITEDVALIARAKGGIGAEAVEFLGEYHTSGLFGRLRYHFVYKKQELPTSELAPFWNYAHETIAASIDALKNAKGVKR